MISVVIPTLGTRDFELKRLLKSLEEQTYQDFEVIIVSQDNHNMIKSLITSYDINIKQIELNKKGLSLARNTAIDYLHGTIVTFSDDDCWYPKDSFSKVVKHFENDTSDLLCFQIFDPSKNEYYKDYLNHPQPKLSSRELFKKSSIELFINTNKVSLKEFKFDEQFGLGASYPSGEENIFLFDLHKAGYCISYFPEKIVFHAKPNVKTRLNYLTFIGKGPLFKRIFNTPTALVVVTMFFVRKYKFLESPWKSLFGSYLQTLKYTKGRV